MVALTAEADKRQISPLFNAANEGHAEVAVGQPMEMTVVEVAMHSDPGSRRTRPSGLLIQRAGDHVASADQLIQQSQLLIARIRDRIHQTDDRVERTFHRIQVRAGRSRLAEPAATGARGRYLQAKRRELAAHERAIRRHDEAAELQERFGHADRAAAAREHGRQARELHALALEELYSWTGWARADEQG